MLQHQMEGENTSELSLGKVLNPYISPNFFLKLRFNCDMTEKSIFIILLFSGSYFRQQLEVITPTNTSENSEYILIQVFKEL